MGDLTKVLVAFIIVGLPIIAIFGYPMLKRVLERIVTDKGIVVADEIERLRDRPVN